MNEPVEIMGNYDYQHVAKCVKYIKLIEDKYSVDSNSDIEEKNDYDRCQVAKQNQDKFYCVVEWCSFLKYGKMHIVKPSKVPYRKVFEKDPNLILQYYENKVIFEYK